jgi:hypothetical protein
MFECGWGSRMADGVPLPCKASNRSLCCKVDSKDLELVVGNEVCMVAGKIGLDSSEAGLVG